MTTNKSCVAETTHAIVEDSEALKKDGKNVSHQVSVVSICEDRKKGARVASTGNINLKKRLTSTSSSTSSQSPSTCCQYVSVVVTNENQISNHENSVSCQNNIKIQLTKDNETLHPNSMEISNENESPVELKHNSNDVDIPSNAEHISGNQDNVGKDIQMVIIENKNSESDKVDYDNTSLHKQNEVEDNILYDRAFTDDSCIQFIDAESTE